MVLEYSFEGVHASGVEAVGLDPDEFTADEVETVISELTPPAKTHTLNLSTSELELLREILDNVIETKSCLSVDEQLNHYDHNGELEDTDADDVVELMRWRVGLLRDEPQDPEVNEYFNALSFTKEQES